MRPWVRRLAFRRLTDNTARTVLGDGREQGLAVHSIRSWADTNYSKYDDPNDDGFMVQRGEDSD